MLDNKSDVVEKKNSSKKNVVVIVLLILAICGLVFYICYDKGLIFSNKEETNDGNKTKEEVVEKQDVKETLALDDSRFYKIYDNLKNYTYLVNRENGYKSFSNDELGNISILGLVNSDVSMTGEKTQWGGDYYIFSASKCESELKSHFGKDVVFDKNSIVGKSYVTKVNIGEGSGMVIESYDSSKDTYKVRFGGLGGATGPAAKEITRKIVSAKLVNDVITVEEKAIYISVSGDYNTLNYTIYSDPQKTKVLDTKNYNVSDVNTKTISVDDYLNSASTITHSYKLDSTSGNYYFVSSKIN